MLTPQNPLKAKLDGGKPVIGTWSIISSPVVVEILALSGFDFLILDMEHGIYDQTALDACIRACESAGCSPLVRVPGMNPSAAQWALDLGAHGVVVPQVGDADSARRAVEMTKFAPAGTRGYNPFTRAASYAAPESNREGKLRNEFGLTSVIVENQTALNELDAILSIAELDVVYMGVYDLSIALGYAGNTQHPELCRTVEEAIRRTVRAGKRAGLMVRSHEDVTKAVLLGATFLVYSVDTYLIGQAAKRAVSEFSQGVSDAHQGPVPSMMELP